MASTSHFKVHSIALAALLALERPVGKVGRGHPAAEVQVAA